MNNIEEIMQAICIGLLAAAFLLNTGRALKAIELCKEGLVLLNNQVPSKTKQTGQNIYRTIYETMFMGYLRISDNTNAITCGRNLLAISRECSDTVRQGNLGMVLAEVYWSKGMYAEAKELYERTSIIMTEIGDGEGEAKCNANLGAVYISLGQYVEAKKFLEKALAIILEISDRQGAATCYKHLGVVFQSLGKHVQAKEYLHKALAMTMEIGDRAGEASCCGNLGTVLHCLGQYLKAKEYCEKALEISMKIGDKEGEARDYGNLGTVFASLGEHGQAKEYLHKALALTMEIGDREGEASFSGNLGNVFQSLGQYVKSKEYHEKALAIRREIGDKAGEASSYECLGSVFESLCQYVRAKEYYEKALAIRMIIGDKEKQARNYGNLGTVFGTLGEYVKAKEYQEKALAMTMEIGDRAGEASCYENLGTVFQSLGQYLNAKEYYVKALEIRIKIGDKGGQTRDYGHLGTVFVSLGEYVEAKEYLEKALAITMDIGYRAGEASCYGNLGTVFQSLGQYVKAKEYYEKALAITMELGDRKGEAGNYNNKGKLFQTLGEYVEAKEYFEKALKIRMEIGDRNGEAEVYAHLGALSLCLRKYRNSKAYYDKALAIFSEIGSKAGEAAVYGHLGCLLQSLGDKVKAKEHYRKSLAIALQIGDKDQEATNYFFLGCVFLTLNEFVMAQEYFEKALLLVKNIGSAQIERQCYLYLSLTKLSQKKLKEAFSWLSQSINKCEELRGVNAESDYIEISLADELSFPYQLLSRLFCATGNPRNALNVVELGRARALADLMATQYSAEEHTSADSQSWTGIENVMKNESNCTCLYISYDTQEVFLWLLEKSGAIHYRNMRVEEKTLHTRLAKVARNLDEFFAIMAESFRSFGISPEEVCEDRALNDTEPKLESRHDESLETFRRGKDKGDLRPSLTLFYEMLINPVSDLLDDPEIIIVPDRGLYRVPFPALLNESGKHLTETLRIRMVPSLTTLKLIQDSPADYHSQTGALVVGDPEVGEVIYRGRLNRKFIALPGAREEAEMIGRMLGVQPLLGKHATKQAVLERISSVSLIHIAAHGNAERGEIALAPAGLTTEISQEHDYLLKMSDISEVKVRAKLVVLSCCHSGRGQIRAEGVVGLARAFLGYGARSVLVALWALEDRATEQLMRRFYERLVRGVSASESLHEAMKWMRENGFSKVHEWAPFMLIGDNVSFTFGKKVSYHKVKTTHSFYQEG